LVTGVGPSDRAAAGVIFTINQVGPDVVITGNGSYNLTGATLVGTGSQDGFVGGASGAFAVGGPFGPVDLYALTTNPGLVSTGPFVNGTPDVGDRFGLDTVNFGGFLTVPRFYTSGTPLSGSTRFANRTLAGLGLTPGTYVYGIPNDTLTVRVNPVPEPLSVAVFGGLVTVGGLVARRRMKA
jgi:hypothetical protein